MEDVSGEMLGFLPCWRLLPEAVRGPVGLNPSHDTTVPALPRETVPIQWRLFPSVCLDVCFGFKRFFNFFSVKKSSTRCLLLPQKPLHNVFFEKLGFPVNVSTRICTRIPLQRLESMMPKARWTFVLRFPSPACRDESVWR